MSSNQQKPSIGLTSIDDFIKKNAIESLFTPDHLIPAGSVNQFALIDTIDFKECFKMYINVLQHEIIHLKLKYNSKIKDTAKFTRLNTIINKIYGLPNLLPSNNNNTAKFITKCGTQLIMSMHINNEFPFCEHPII